MRDLIDRQAAIRKIEPWLYSKCRGESEINMLRAVIDTLKNMTAAPRWVMCEEGCDLCRDDRLEKGDTLYQSSDWDGGIGFDYISDIQFCPKCGRELTQWKPEPPKEDA